VEAAVQLVDLSASSGIGPARPAGNHLPDRQCAHRGRRHTQLGEPASNCAEEVTYTIRRDQPNRARRRTSGSAPEVNTVAAARRSGVMFAAAQRASSNSGGGMITPATRLRSSASTVPSAATSTEPNGYPVRQRLAASSTQRRRCRSSSGARGRLLWVWSQDMLGGGNQFGAPRGAVVSFSVLVGGGVAGHFERLLWTGEQSVTQLGFRLLFAGSGTLVGDGRRPGQRIVKNLRHQLPGGLSASEIVGPGCHNVVCRKAHSPRAADRARGLAALRVGVRSASRQDRCEQMLFCSPWCAGRA